jgi:2-polyprenyl-3-methyl-5-hydroxy-6-metoxy-1,4-benzoquinol methylase
MSESKKVVNYFTRAALTFDALYTERKMGSFMRLINRHFRRDIYERYILCMEHIQKHNAKTVLDVGCGSGRYAKGLSEVGVKRILGIDFSYKMIELAKENVKNIQESNRIFEFICFDFMEFNTKETYDIVIAMGFFDYIKESIPVLIKMRQLSNHSVIVSFPSFSFYRTLIRKIRYYLKRCPVYFYKPEMINNFAVKAGFTNCNVKKIKGAGMDYFVTFFK